MVDKWRGPPEDSIISRDVGTEREPEKSEKREMWEIELERE